MPLSLKTHERSDYDAVIKHLTEKGYDEAALSKVGRWISVISGGPWYGDSDIEGQGQSESESVSKAVDIAKKLRDDLNDFLKDYP